MNRNQKKNLDSLTGDFQTKYVVANRKSSFTAIHVKYFGSSKREEYWFTKDRLYFYLFKPAVNIITL